MGFGLALFENGKTTGAAGVTVKAKEPLTQTMCMCVCVMLFRRVCFGFGAGIIRRVGADNHAWEQKAFLCFRPLIATATGEAESAGSTARQQHFANRLDNFPLYQFGGLTLMPTSWCMFHFLFINKQNNVCFPISLCQERGINLNLHEIKHQKIYYHQPPRTRTTRSTRTATR